VLLREVVGTAYLLLPLAGGAVLHGLCLRYGWLGFLARPIDGGRIVRGRPLFGHSKTFRGPVAVAAGAGAVFALQQGLLHRCGPFASIELIDRPARSGLLPLGSARRAARLLAGRIARPGGHAAAGGCFDRHRRRNPSAAHLSGLPPGHATDAALSTASPPPLRRARRRERRGIAKIRSRRREGTASAPMGFP